MEGVVEVCWVENVKTEQKRLKNAELFSLTPSAHDWKFVNEFQQLRIFEKLTNSEILEKS